MHPGPIEVVAYQETLLLMAVFGIAILAMIWAGFRRWLQHQEKLRHLAGEQAAELSSQLRAQMERVEARLNAIEQKAPAGPAIPIEGPPANADVRDDKFRASE